MTCPQFRLRSLFASAYRLFFVEPDPLTAWQGEWWNRQNPTYARFLLSIILISAALLFFAVVKMRTTVIPVDKPPAPLHAPPPKK
ncbi:MAG TPA: hypothetical protein VND64_23740 [Pirellulales bacterium]|nr:hypothetical protein [Pirellulales bacterium]